MFQMIEIRPHNHASELISLSDAYLERNECENNLPPGTTYRLGMVELDMCPKRLQSGQMSFRIDPLQ